MYFFGFIFLTAIVFGIPLSFYDLPLAEAGNGASRSKKEGTRSSHQSAPAVREQVQEEEQEKDLDPLFDPIALREMFEKARIKAQAQPGFQELQEGIRHLRRSELREAVEQFQIAAALGNPDGMTHLAAMSFYGLGGIEQDVASGIASLENAAAQGSSGAVARLGHLFQFGLFSIEKDPVRAFRLYQESVKQGDPEGMIGLAMLLQHGTGGIARDPLKAACLIQVAASLGDPSGIAHLGYLYEEGVGGIGKDPAKAVELYQQSADLNCYDGMRLLLYCYRDGACGVAKDEAKTIELLRRLRDIGDAQAGTDLEILMNEIQKRPKPLSRTVQIAAEDTCCICLDAFLGNTSRITTLSCSHSFHTKCLNEWESKNNRCPLCKAQIPKE